jgi:hypothetical protein
VTPETRKGDKLCHPNHKEPSLNHQQERGAQNSARLRAHNEDIWKATEVNSFQEIHGFQVGQLLAVERAANALYAFIQCRVRCLHATKGRYMPHYTYSHKDNIHLKWRPFIFKNLRHPYDRQRRTLTRDLTCRSKGTSQAHPLAGNARGRGCADHRPKIRVNTQKIKEIR